MGNRLSVARVSEYQSRKHGLEPGTIRTSELRLTDGSISNVFRVVGGPVCLIALFLQITQAVADSVVTLAINASPDIGVDSLIGDALSIQDLGIGSFVWSECDGTELIPAAAGTTLPIKAIGRGDANGLGIIIPEGGINFILSAMPATGKCVVYAQYRPLVHGACLICSDMQSSTTSTTSTSSTSSTTSSTSSSTSTTSSTSSTTATASTSTTSSTSSTSSTTSTTTSGGE
jgi:hypothetical protein